MEKVIRLRKLWGRGSLEQFLGNVSKGFRGPLNLFHRLAGEVLEVLTEAILEAFEIVSCVASVICTNYALHVCIRVVGSYHYQVSFCPTALRSVCPWTVLLMNDIVWCSPKV